MSEDWRDALRGLMPDTPAEPDAPAETDPSPATPRCSELKVSTERKGRAGKTATIIYGFPEDFPEAEISSLASRLRHSLGTGGSARGGEILLQGDRARDAASALRTLGFKAKIC